MPETLLLSLTIVLMAGVLLITLIPVVPGPAIMWSIAIIAGALTDFTRLPIALAVVMTVLMVIASIKDFWLPILGMRASGASCLSGIGALLGSFVGTFAIPIPICGTLIGAVGGALAFEFLHAADARKAIQAGGEAAKWYFIGFLIEYAFTLLIFGLFILGLFLTD